jgi:hypothetical protein
VSRPILASLTVAHSCLHPNCDNSLWFLSLSVRQAASLKTLEEKALSA